MFDIVFDNEYQSSYQSANYSKVKLTDNQWIVWSKNIDSLPITTTEIASQPCMDSFVQTSAASYELEIMQYEYCPMELNTNLTIDPRYNQLTAFKISEYDFQSENGVLALLQSRPSYYTANPFIDQEKQNNEFKAWTRPTFPWSLTCEQAHGQTRQKAVEQYNMRFGSTNKLRTTRNAALGFLITISVLTAIGLLLSVCGGEAEVLMFLAMLAIRFVVLVCLPIMIYRLNHTYDLVQANILQVQKYNTFTSECGDPLAQLDADWI